MREVEFLRPADRWATFLILASIVYSERHERAIRNSRVGMYVHPPSKRVFIRSHCSEYQRHIAIEQSTYVQNTGTI